MCGMHPEDLGVGKLVRMIPRFAALLVSERLWKKEAAENLEAGYTGWFCFGLGDMQAGNKFMDSVISKLSVLSESFIVMAPGSYVQNDTLESHWIYSGFILM